MATYTTNLNLEKPATNENFNLSKINSNWDKIDAGYTSNAVFQVGDTLKLSGTSLPCRSLGDKSGLYFRILLPKRVSNDVNGFSVSMDNASPVWYSAGTLGSIQTTATATTKSINNKRSLNFALAPENTIENSGFGVCELSATITFTASA